MYACIKFLKMIPTFFTAILAIVIVLFDVDATNITALSGTTRIIGGQPAQPNEFPWMISLNIDGFKSYCGGALIKLNAVITAAHCLHSDNYNSGVRKTVVAVAGEHDLNKNGTTEQYLIAKSYIIHERYDVITGENDIAIVHLAKRFRKTRAVRPIKLPPRRFMCRRAGITMGWGQLDNNEEHPTYPNLLQKLTLQINSGQNCLSFIHGSKEFCAGGGVTGTCGGDSGSPFVCSSKPNRIYGIVSRGPRPCAIQDRPGIYTRVPAHVSWIRKNIRPRI